MKSWGTRILFLYLGFVGLIVTLVTLSMKQQTDLVAKDYYAQELAYQSRLDKINRSRALARPVSWKLENGKLAILFPEEVTAPITGTVYLYCPSDAAKDLKTMLNGTGLETTIDLSAAKPGQYQLQLDWQSGAQTYFDEGVINLP